MNTRAPRLEIFPDRIRDNARSIIKLCRSHGAQVAVVTKVASAHAAVTNAVLEAGPDMLADSRIMNLRYLGETGATVPRLLLRLPTQSEAHDAVLNSELSLNSSVATMKKLSDAAVALGKTHQVIVMVDVGDLREGVWPEMAPEVVAQAARLPGIEVMGVGCNLACYGGVIPSQENMARLIAVREECRKKSGLRLDLISGGNSSSLPLLASGKMPAEINHLRLGESILLGRNVIDRSPWPGTRQDTFRLVAEVIEVERKPSVPIGETGQDAFGGTPQYVDRGWRKRAICNIGRQDVVVDGIEPEDGGIIVLGGSSDHLILDVEEAATDVKVGDQLAFYPGYGALLALSTSPYVSKVVVKA